MLKLYNTLSRTIEEFKKPSGRDYVNMYTCGPTAYNYAHIGNLRSFILADLLYRTLKFDGYRPRWVMNITDVDDKTIKGTLTKFGKDATVENLREYTKFYMDEFIADLREVNVLVGEIEFIRVTDKIKAIQEFIVELVKKGYGYIATDGIYFSIEKYQKDLGDYGALVGEKFLEGKKIGARVQVDEYEKDNLSDFALWKNHNPETDGGIFWSDLILDSNVKIANGRPGWHIECSAINKVAFNGEPVDVHTGGVDLIFPHHTNEIAQSEALVGVGNFVHYWSHCEHLQVDGQRMGKRFNNFYTLKDLLAKGFSGQDFRYMMFSSSYRNRQNFTFEDLLASQKARSRYAVNLNFSAQPSKEFIDAINNDLNAPMALAAAMKSGDGLFGAAEVLGIRQSEAPDVPANIFNLINARQEAKQQKDFAKSDEIRKQIENLGYEIMDTPEGPKVKKKVNI